MRVHRDVQAIGARLAGDLEALVLVADVVEIFARRSRRKARKPRAKRRGDRPGA